MVIVLAWVMSQQIWAAVTPAGRAGPAVIGRAAQAGDGPADWTPLLLDFDPFRRQGRAGRAPAVSEDLPQTTLKLVLVGARARPDGGGTAILKLPSGGQSIFEEGAELLPGVRLRRIEPGRVVLEREGRLEALDFFKDGGVMTMPSQGARPSSSTDTPTDVSASAAADRPSSEPDTDRRFVDLEAERLWEGLELRPRRRDGVVDGFMILPRGGDRTVFDYVGLKPGDVLLAVEGRPLTGDPDQLATLMEKLQRAREFSLTLERGGDQVDVIFELGG